MYCVFPVSSALHSLHGRHASWPTSPTIGRPDSFRSGEANSLAISIGQWKERRQTVYRPGWTVAADVDAVVPKPSVSDLPDREADDHVSLRACSRRGLPTPRTPCMHFVRSFCVDEWPLVSSTWRNCGISSLCQILRIDNQYASSARLDSHSATQPTAVSPIDDISPVLPTDGSKGRLFVSLLSPYVRVRPT